MFATVERPSTTNSPVYCILSWISGLCSIVSSARQKRGEWRAKCGASESNAGSRHNCCGTFSALRKRRLGPTALRSALGPAPRIHSLCSFPAITVSLGMSRVMGSMNVSPESTPIFPKSWNHGRIPFSVWHCWFAHLCCLSPVHLGILREPSEAGTRGLENCLRISSGHMNSYRKYCDGKCLKSASCERPNRPTCLFRSTVVAARARNTMKVLCQIPRFKPWLPMPS